MLNRKKALMPFLKKNNILAIIRAHESLPDGYKMHRWNGASDFPLVITVFSAPNYCGEFDNSGGMMTIDESLMCSFRILKPAEKKQKFNYGGLNNGRPVTPPKTQVLIRG